MKNKFTLVFVVTFCILHNTASAQKQITAQLLNHIDSLHQACFDSGGNMWNCSNDFYNQMDSLLNVVYRSIKGKLTPEAFQMLKQEQLKWISKRDIVYSKANKENIKDGLGITDASMAALNTKAEFVKERTLYLLKNYK